MAEISTKGVSFKSQIAENGHRRTANLRKDKPSVDSASRITTVEAIDWTPENIRKILQESGGFSVGVLADLEEIRCSEAPSRLSKRSLPLGSILKQHQGPPEALEAAIAKLVLGALTNEVDLVAQALEEGADINTVSEYGKTPLQISLADSKVSFVSDLLLLYKETRVHLRYSNGETLLHRVAQAGPSTLLRRLIHGMEDLQVFNMDGATPLHVATLDGARPRYDNALGGRGLASLQEIRRIFADQDVFPDAIMDYRGLSVLYVAAAIGLREHALELVRLGCDPGFIPGQVHKGKTVQPSCSPLYVAVKAGHVDLVRLFLEESRGKVNLINERHHPSNTLFECCILRPLIMPRHLEMAGFLLEYGADWRTSKRSNNELLAMAKNDATQRLRLSLIAAGCIPVSEPVDIRSSILHC